MAASILVAVLAFPCRAVPASNARDPEPAEAADDEARKKKDLLKQMKALEAKLPRELARQLIIISINIATGWCSPYRAKEFEAEVGKLSEQERKSFEKASALVRSYPPLLG